MALVILGALLQNPSPDVGCDALWMDLTGYGWRECLQLNEAWPLLHFSFNQPYLQRAFYDQDGRFIAKRPRIELAWRSVEPGAQVEAAGRIGGHRVYRITRAPQQIVFVWEVAPSEFRPLAILDGSGAIVDSISNPETFSWRGREVIGFRVYYSGMGAQQESLFFSLVDGRLNYLPEDTALHDYVKANRITIYHRNGRFCPGTLIWQNWAGYTDDEARSGDTVLRATYTIDGNRLRLESAVLARNDRGKTDC